MGYREGSPLWASLVAVLHTRGCSYKIRGQSFKNERHGDFISQRVVNVCNSHSQGWLTRSLEIFKVEVDKYLNNTRIEGYRDVAQKS